MKYAEIYESLMTLNQQARALVGQSNLMLRTLEPLVREETQQPEERKQPKVFGRKENG